MKPVAHIWHVVPPKPFSQRHTQLGGVPSTVSAWPLQLTLEDVQSGAQFGHPA